MYSVEILGEVVRIRVKIDEDNYVFLYQSTSPYSYGKISVHAGGGPRTVYHGFTDDVPNGLQEMIDGAIENEFIQPLIDWCTERAPEPFNLLFTDSKEFVRIVGRVGKGKEVKK